MILGIVASSIKQGTAWTPADNLIAYYSFDNHADDLIGTNNATTNGTTYSTGKSGEALHVADTTSAGATVSSTTDLSFGNGTTDVPFSISFYVNFDTWTTGTRAWLIARRPIQDSNLEYQIGIYDRVLYFVIYNQGGNTINLELAYDLGTDITAGSWHHMIFTYDGNGLTSSLNFYLDNGSSLGTTTEIGGSYTAMSVSTSPITIGYVGYNSSLSLDGLLDGVGFWDIELDSSQRTEIYNTQNGGDELVIATISIGNYTDSFVGADVTTPLTFQHTCATGTKMVTASLAGYRTGDPTVLSATFGGVAMTERHNSWEADTDAAVAHWDLADPTIGVSTDIVITWTTAAISEVSVMAADLIPSAGSIGIDVVSSGSEASNGNPSDPITTVADYTLVMDIMQSKSNSVLTVGSGQTELSNLDQGLTVSGQSYKIMEVAGATTMSWTGGVGDWVKMVSMSYKVI